MSRKPGTTFSFDDEEQIHAVNEQVQDLKSKWGLKTKGEVILKLLAMVSQLEQVEHKVEHEVEDLTDEEQSTVTKALRYSQSTLPELQKKGLLAECRGIVTSYEKIQSVDVSELGNSTTRGAAQARIDATVKVVMEHNQESESFDQWYITQSLIFKLCGSNRAAIRKYFEDFQHLIDDHHQQYELTESANRKGKGSNSAESVLKPKVDAVLKSD